MTPAAELWLLLGASAASILLLYLAVREARKRAALRPPVVIRRSRSEPLFGWDFAGAGYVVQRRRLSTSESVSNASFETIAIDAPPLPVRFLVDQGMIYRGMTDLFTSANVDSSRIAPDLKSFWRTDERERLQWLINDERFGTLLREMRTVPDFAALAVADANDARLPIGTALRKVQRIGDVIALTRSGDEVPYRDQRDAEEDVARLSKLRELLSSMHVPDILERAAAPGVFQTSLMRVLRMIILFALIIAGMWMLGWLLWRL